MNTEFIDWKEYPKNKPNLGGAYLVTKESIGGGRKDVDIVWYIKKSEQFQGSFKDLLGYNIIAWSELPKPLAAC